MIHTESLSSHPHGLEELQSEKKLETHTQIQSMFHCIVPQCGEEFHPEIIILDSPTMELTTIFFCPKCNTIYRANGFPYPMSKNDYVLMIDDPKVERPSNLLASS